MAQSKLDKIFEKIDAGREYRFMEVRVKANKAEADEEDESEEKTPAEGDDEAEEDAPAEGDNKPEKEKPAEEDSPDGEGETDPNEEDKDEEEGKKKRSYMVEGYATTFNEPYELFACDGYVIREQVDPHAFDEADMSDVIMQYDHQGRVFARNKNGTLQLKTDGRGLHMEANLGGTEAGRQLFEEIEGGYTTKMSFGFKVDEDVRQVTKNRETNVTEVLRTITRVRKLYDVSAVSLPANGGTEISVRSYCDGLIAELEAEILKDVEKEKARAEILASLRREKARTEALASLHKNIKEG